MGHNTSREKAERDRRTVSAAALRPLLVPGWTIAADGKGFAEIDSVLGASLRGQAVLFRCSGRDCRRRIELDLRATIDAGLGDRRPRDLVASLACRHWRGCALRLEHTTYPGGVPLIAFLAHADVLIAVSCTACPARTLLPPIRVIERLIAGGRGDGATGLLELGRKARGPCRRCGGRAFEGGVVWLKPTGRTNETPAGGGGVPAPCGSAGPEP